MEILEDAAELVPQPEPEHMQSTGTDPNQRKSVRCANLLHHNPCDQSKPRTMQMMNIHVGQTLRLNRFNDHYSRSAAEFLFCRQSLETKAWLTLCVGKAEAESVDSNVVPLGMICGVGEVLERITAYIDGGADASICELFLKSAPTDIPIFDV